MENSWKCPRCGAENLHKFCSSCGFERKETKETQETQEKQQKTAAFLNNLFGSSENKNKVSDTDNQNKENDDLNILVPKVVVDNPKEDATKEEQITYNFLQYQKELKQKSKNQPSSSTNKEKDSVSSFLSAAAKQQSKNNNKNTAKPQTALKPSDTPQGILTPQKTTKYLEEQKPQKENNAVSVSRPEENSVVSDGKTHNIPSVEEASSDINKKPEKSKKINVEVKEQTLQNVSETNASVILQNIERDAEDTNDAQRTEKQEKNTIENKNDDSDAIKKENTSVSKDKIEKIKPTETVDVFEKYDNETAKNKIHKMSVSPEMEIKLQTVLFPHVRGFRYVFLGNAGSKKDAVLKEIAKVMCGIGKIRKPECNHIAFHEIPDIFDPKVLYVIEDLSAAVANLFNFDDLSTSSTVTQEEYKKRLNALIGAGNTAYIILNTNTTEIKGFMPIDPRLGFVFPKSNWIDFPELSNAEIADAFLEYLPEFHKSLVTPSFRDETIKYLDRNRRYFPFNNYELASYLATQTALSEVLSLPPEKHNSNTLSKSFENIIGMKIVKDQIGELNQYLVARAKLEAMGAKLPSFNLHMMFLGNPGVGKTTIARIIAKLLFDLGYIKEDKLIEVASNDLIGVHGNETGMKTNKVIMSALGGVLFVDEAYSLSQSCGAAGLEAIATLVKCMEDYKENLVCMFAGYSKEMDDFTRSNSGIASRINYIFEFEDYTAQELYEIFELKLNRMGLSVSPDAKETLFKVTKFGAGRRNFGNGRYVDKLLQRALTKHGLLDLPKDKMLVLQKESIPTVEEIMKSFGRFSA